VTHISTVLMAPSPPALLTMMVPQSADTRGNWSDYILYTSPLQPLPQGLLVSRKHLHRLIALEITPRSHGKCVHIHPF
jgi:hypothetical protein